jgi:hypothetical protein
MYPQTSTLERKKHLNNPLSRLQVQKFLHPMPEEEQNPTPYPSTTTAEKLNDTVDQLLDSNIGIIPCMIPWTIKPRISKYLARRISIKVYPIRI